MEGGSVLSPSSRERRRAWARQSRCWRAAVLEKEEEEEEEEEEAAAAALQDDPELQPPALDDVFLEGSSSSKIETWLQECSISEVLEWWQEDAEEILSNLGFVQGGQGAVGRVPARFFSAPSRASGIDFQLFLTAQLRRLELEDPCLLLASRFQQVQAVAATADAFFCLYSYVSRTLLQRFCPSPASWLCPHVPELRDGTSPVPTGQPGALGKVAKEVLGPAREEKFGFDPADGPQGKGTSAQGHHCQELVDSFETEEVLSASEEEEEDGDDEGDDGFLLRASRGQSDSSGFVEEPVPGQLPAAHGANQRL
ncbi:protein TESPA1 [Indicator indicator]|uniref:protein TESPA1 n=1 Tax=Indicator indicator TaxID=1002788 RepID=UPI0023DF2C1B|nr:protein TESPA1 [Indicator indicator]